jgi:quinol monooxygenase YgiN
MNGAPNDVTVIIDYRAQPGRAEEALKEIAQLVDTVVERESDCHGISVLVDTDDPTRIRLVEQWPDRQSYLGPHLQQPHIQEFIAKAGAFIAGPPDITFWQAKAGDLRLTR